MNLRFKEILLTRSKNNNSSLLDNTKRFVIGVFRKRVSMGSVKMGFSYIVASYVNLVIKKSNIDKFYIKLK